MLTGGRYRAARAAKNRISCFYSAATNSFEASKGIRMLCSVHLLIYMRGVKMQELSALVDFLYLGEANVFQENLDSFLTIAE